MNDFEDDDKFNLNGDPLDDDSDNFGDNLVDDLPPEEFEPFVVRYKQEIKESIIIVSVLVFFFVYSFVGPLKSIIDLAVNPAVAGITIVYGKISQGIFKLTGINLGFIPKTTDPNFLFRVQVANYINQKEAGPLVEIAVDQLAPRHKREMALAALLKFENSSDWVQPFLNELFKGGMVQLYDEEAPILDALMKKIRSEGGIRNSLVRAYAEVVFSFMLQVPDQPIVRQRALSWLNDIMAEDALFLIIPRLGREDDPDTQAVIEEALWNVRAISDPQKALQELYPYYRKPQWPGAKVAMAIVMARLGHDGAVRVLSKASSRGELTDEQKVDVRVAMAKKPFPKELRITPREEIILANRSRRRANQYAAALRKKQLLERQEQRRLRLAQRSQTQTEPKASATQLASAKPATEKTTVSSAPQPPVETRTQKDPQQGSQKKAVSMPALETKQKPLPPTFRDPAPAKEPVAPPTQVASLPKKEPAVPAPPIEPPAEAPKKDEGEVDIVFQTINQDIPLYKGAGFDQPLTGVILPAGTKGKAKLKKVVDENNWFQVETKKGNGWAHGEFLKVYDLSPGFMAANAVPKEPDPVESKFREEFTYFEPSINDAPVYAKTSAKSKKVAVLKEGVAYRAIQSEKKGSNRWFKLKVGDETEGWVQGIDLQLSDNIKKPKQNTPQSFAKAMPGRMKDQMSSFAPEWVVPGVMGVGVYNRPSIAGDLLQTISPPHIYRVTDMKEGSGKEWYKIKLTKSRSGWVQSLDVNLTKPQ